MIFLPLAYQVIRPVGREVFSLALERERREEMTLAVIDLGRES
jgi:hypothetical protein